MFILSFLVPRVTVMSYQERKMLRESWTRLWRKRGREKRQIPETGWEDYPVGGLSPFLLGRHHGLGGHRPAPEHFVVVHRDVGFLRQGPVEPGCDEPFITQRHVGDSQAGRSGRGGGICRHSGKILKHVVDKDAFSDGLWLFLFP